MTALLIRHTVADYATWRRIHDEQEDTRRANGSHRGRIFRGDADPHEILLLLEWDHGERAWLFARSDDLREAMVRAGVIDQPDVWILKEVDRPAF